MTAFTFCSPAMIRFGAGQAAGLPDVVAGLGHRVLLVSGSHPERVALLQASLPVVGRVAITGEPTFDDVRAGLAMARERAADVVVAVGGGSVLDAAKAIAILVGNRGDPLDFAEVIGAGRPLTRRGLPVVAVPTTAGTGAEATANAVLRSPLHRVKVSLRSPLMLPAVVVVDPELTLSCPPAVTASAGMDALTQCLESLVSHAATPLTDLYASEGLRRAASGLRAAYADGSDLAARTAMSLCALLSGLSLANAKLGAVHGFAGVIGGMTGAPHGEICASLLVACSAANLAAMGRRDPDNPAVGKYAQAALALCGVADARAGLDWLARTAGLLGVRRLGELGLAPDDVEACVDAAMASSSMKGNPIVLTRDELRAVVASAW